MKLHQLLATATVLAVLGFANAHAKQQPAPPFEPTLPWLSNFDEAVAAAQKSGKPILVEFR